MSSSSPERPVGTIVKVLWPNDGKTYQGVIKRIDDGQTLIYFPATHEEWFCTEKDMKTLVSIVSMPKSNRPPPNQSALLSVQVPKASRISALENVIAEILNETNESCNTKTPTSSNDIFLKAATEISALIHSKEPGLVSNLACVFLLLLFCQYHVMHMIFRSNSQKKSNWSYKKCKVKSKPVSNGLSVLVGTEQVTVQQYFDLVI